MKDGPSSESSSFTGQQLEAIRAEGNVLLIAGAGTGKTRTLVERCVQWVLQRKASLDEILMVTFTEAAAAELRKRIRERLERARDERPEDPIISEQLALCESAAIFTLHSFCFRLIRQHFYELQLDPQVSVLTEQQARVLQEETLDLVLEEVYQGTHPSAASITQLVRILGQGRDSKVRDLVRRVHEHAQTRPDPDTWLARELQRL